MKYLSLVAIVLLLNSCTSQEVLVVKKEPKIVEVPALPKVNKKEYVEDLIKYSQNVATYTQNIDAKKLFSQEAYEKSYFSVWNTSGLRTSVDDAKWAHKRYKAGNTYGENLQLLKKDFFDAVLENANFKEYGLLNKKALTINTVNLRAMPSEKPVLLDPSKAGEGFPFDYLQNSLIAANKPLLISHYSKDGKWAFVESSFAFGWVKSRNIALIKDKYTQVWQRAEQVFVIKDGIPIYSQDGYFLFKSRVGMMFPLIGEEKESYTVLTIAKYKHEKPLYIESKISKDTLHKGILEFNTENINTIINEVSKTNYGWGGIYAQRDCSSTLRDFYAPFGLWLPRNSYKQSQVGKVISLDGLSKEEKIHIIKEKALPFRTLLYKQGHIMLYVGVNQDKIIVYQNVWGVKTKKDGIEGRFIIGRPIFSTLEVGSNLKNYDKNSSVLVKLKSLSIL